MIFENKSILITGGTGSLGQQLVKRIFSFEQGIPRKLVVFSRDEAKQHQMRIEFKQKKVATDELIYHQADEIIEFVIGDVRNPDSLLPALKDADIVVNAAALKQVPTCEYFPIEAVNTNINGAANIVNLIAAYSLPVKTVVGVSTDKACKPVNVMGMTKSLQERVIIGANLKTPDMRFICVRYGNVLISRGSVIPLFIHQIRSGGPVTITDPLMTRFLLSLDTAVDTIFDAISKAQRGETFIPKVRSARLGDIADFLIAGRPIKKQYTGIRPGEKLHEILISEEEMFRTVDRKKYYAIQPLLPELRDQTDTVAGLEKEYSSADHIMSKEELKELFRKNNIFDIEKQGIEEGV